MAEMSSRDESLSAAPPMGGRVVRGVFWSAAAQVSRQGVQFVVGVVLARLLTPDDFGVFGMVVVISAFATTVADLGLGSAVVQARSITAEQVSTVFWLSLASGMAIGGIVALSGNALASFYSDDRVAEVARLLGLSAAVMIAGSIPRSLLVREMRFRAVAIVDMVSVTLAAVVGIGGAIAGAEYWAIAYQSFALASTTSVLNVLVCRWRPRLVFAMTEARDLMRFGLNLTGFASLNFWSRNADNLMIGRVEGPVELGLYTRAYGLMLLPVTQFSRSIGNVMLSALARVQNERDRVRDAYLRAISAIAVLAFPVAVGSAVAAPDLVPALLGARWSDAVPYYQILSLAGLPQALGTTTGWIYQSQGETRALLRWGAISTAVTILAFAVGIQWGVLGLAIAYVVRTYVLTWFNFKLAGAIINLDPRQVLHSVVPQFFGALVVGGCVFVGGFVTDAWPVTVSAAAQVVIGITAYAVFMVATKAAAFRNAWNTVLRSRRTSG